MIHYYTPPLCHQRISHCIISGCDGGSDGGNGLSDIRYQNASLFREDNQLYEKLQNNGCAEFTAGHQVATDKIQFKIYDVMRFYDRHDVLKNAMNNFMTDSGPNHVFFAWCHSNHPRSGVNEFMEYFQNHSLTPDLHQLHDQNYQRMMRSPMMRPLMQSPVMQSITLRQRVIQQLQQKGLI